MPAVFHVLLTRKIPILQQKRLTRFFKWPPRMAGLERSISLDFLIKNGLVYDPAQACLERRDVALEAIGR